MPKRKAEVSAREESRSVPATEENQPATIPEGGHWTAVGDRVDTRRVSIEGATSVQGVAEQIAICAISLGATEDTAAVASSPPRGNVANVGNDTAHPVPVVAYTPPIPGHLLRFLQKGKTNEGGPLKPYGLY